MERRTVTIKSVTGIIVSIEHEDGSGYSFNVMIRRELGNPDSDFNVYLYCPKA